WDRPRKQPRCCGKSGLSGCVSSVFWRMTTPSLTRTLFKHRLPQLCQQAAVFHTPSSLFVSNTECSSALAVNPRVTGTAADAARAEDHPINALLDILNSFAFLNRSSISIAPFVKYFPGVIS